MANTEPEFELFWNAPHPLSQWTESRFVCERGEEYACAEQYMMSEKARLFGDEDVRASIMRAGNDPKQHKALGRMVSNFDEAVWKEHRMQIVTQASRLKFTQNDALRAYLLQTGDKVLVEASPFDKIWGIGLGPKDPRARDPKKWKGLNLLGQALMQVRDDLRKE